MDMKNLYGEKLSRKKGLAFAVQLVLYGIVYYIAYAVNVDRNVISGVLLLFLAVETYLFFAAMARDLVDINGVFFGTWTGSIGLCMFRMSPFQRPWLASSWVDFAMTPVVFCALFYLIQQVMEKKFVFKEYIHIGKYKFEYRKNNKRCFYLMVFCMMLTIVFMTIQYMIRGFFPLFTSGATDRVDFYTRLIVLISATEFTPAICFYLIHQDDVCKWKKAVLCVAIAVPFIAALLRLSRGEYAVAMMLLIPSLYYFSKKKILVLVLSFALFVGGYCIATTARPEAKESLDYYWTQRYMDDDGGYVAEQEAQEETMEPAEAAATEQPATEAPSITEAPAIEETPVASDVPTTDVQAPAEDVPQISGGDASSAVSEVPADVAEAESYDMSKLESFTYYYLINGFENYDFATRNVEEYTHGLRQLHPFTVAFRLNSLRDKIEALPSYTWIPGTTKCLIADFYLDFGRWAVYVGMALWGLVAGIIHYIAKKRPGGISMAIHGVCFVVCSLAFFNPWLSYFQMWMFWGTGMLLSLPNIKISKWRESVPKLDEDQGE